MAPAAKKPKGPGAYMVFSEEHRADVQAKLRAESADGKVPITVIAKALGELWKSLTEEQQQEYREKAQERAAEAAAAAEGQHVCRESTMSLSDGPGNSWAQNYA